MSRLFMQGRRRAQAPPRAAELARLVAPEYIGFGQARREECEPAWRTRGPAIAAP